MELTRIEFLEESLRSDPNSAFLRYALAMEFMNAGRGEEAWTQFEHLLAHHPDYAATYYQAGKFLAALDGAASAPTAPLRPSFAELNCRDAFPERAASFTEAQQRVFELLVTGLPNKLIAYEIGVSEATVKAHVSAVLRKLRVRSRAQAIALSSAFERDRNGRAAAAL